MLGISLHTCCGYLKAVYAKLGVSTQLVAVIKAKALWSHRIPAWPPSSPPALFFTVATR